MTKYFESNPESTSAAPVEGPSTPDTSMDTGEPADVFSDLMSSIEGAVEESTDPTLAAESQEETSTPETSEAVTPETPVEETAPAAETETPETTPEPEPEAQATPEQEPVTPSEPEASQEDLEAQWKEQREKTLPQLEQLYQLTDEQMEAIQDDPGKVFPQLAAQLHFNVQTAMWNSMQTVLPQFIGQMLKFHKTTEERFGRFYEAFPDLKGAGYDELISQNTQAVLDQAKKSGRTLNEEQLFQAVGGMTLAMAGIVPKAREATETSAPPAPAPAAPAVQPPTAGPLGKGPANPNPQPRPVEMSEQESVIDELATFVLGK